MKNRTLVVPALSFLLLSTLSLACMDTEEGAMGSSAGSPEESQKVEALSAFARMYGYVRFFHPSDEASGIDWDRFAVLGVERVGRSGSADELKTALEELFLPIAPTARIYLTEEGPPALEEQAPQETAGLQVVAWQHLGFGQGGSGGPYSSIRTNRENRIASQGGAVLTQGLEAGDLRGKEIRLRALVRAEVEGPGSQGSLWLRVDREGNERGFFDNMADRPITQADWQTYEILGDVADDATRVVFGAIFQGEGLLGLDDFDVEVRESGGEWQPIEVPNSGFEADDVGGGPSSWGSSGPGTVFQVTDDGAGTGQHSLILSREAEVFTGVLFDAVPSQGEVTDKELGGGVSARIPLALFSDDSGTLGSGAPESLAELEEALAGISLGTLTGDDEAVRLADVVIAWNVFQHFYPYFDEVGADWEAALPEFLGRALSDSDGESFFRTLQMLVARLRDGHGRVVHASYQPRASVPALFEWIEDRMVVTVSQDPELQPGDVILSIDGIDTGEAVREAEEFISGSAQWMRVRAMRELGLGEEGSTTLLEVSREGETLEVAVERVPFQPVAEARPENIDELEEGVFYVNLDQATAEDIQGRIDDLAAATGVVFDLRGYPNGNHMVIDHLLQIPDTSESWMRVLRVIYPDQEGDTGYQPYGWSLQPRSPHIGGKVVFLTDGRAISYAESFMSFIAHYDLAEIVGQPTAGANGNVNPFVLPGGFRVIYTGMKVVKHDGSQHHTVGVLPTVPMERTIQGVREGRDELLEKALEIIRG